MANMLLIWLSLGGVTLIPALMWLYFAKGEHVSPGIAAFILGPFAGPIVLYIAHKERQ